MSYWFSHIAKELDVKQNEPIIVWFLDLQTNVYTVPTTSSTMYLIYNKMS